MQKKYDHHRTSQIQTVITFLIVINSLCYTSFIMSQVQAGHAEYVCQKCGFQQKKELDSRAAHTEHVAQHRAEQQKTESPKQHYAYFQSLLSPRVCKKYDPLHPLVRQVLNLSCAGSVAGGLSYGSCMLLRVAARYYLDQPTGSVNRDAGLRQELGDELARCLDQWDGTSGSDTPRTRSGSRPERAKRQAQLRMKKMNDLIALAGVLVWVAGTVGIMFWLNRKGEPQRESAVQVLERLMDQWLLHRPFVPEQFVQRCDQLHTAYQTGNGCLQLSEDEAEALVKQMVMVCLEAEADFATKC
ncbi:MAG: hypothetical protein H6679_04565 [Epsilonproteobacteria bacterium]|nr:hypothetical protein [Campylobacterota bacterium]